MSYYFTAQVNGELRWAQVGTNGSQVALLGLWLLAYGVAGRPHSRRVRARWYEVVQGAPDGLWGYDESVAGAHRLIACNADGQSWVTVSSRNDATITRGLKLKPVTDPPLGALVDYWRLYMSDCEDRELGVDLTARLTEAFSLLLPHLEPSCWHPKLVSITNLFSAASAAGVNVSHG